MRLKFPRLSFESRMMLFIVAPPVVMCLGLFFLWRFVL